MNLAIIDSGGANITSVRFAMQRLGADPVFTADAEEIRRADRVILPGVGAAATGMRRLRELGLVDCIRALSQPVLGICLGMQLLFESSEEGDTDCLGLVPGRLRRLSGGDGLRVPHMGWNQVYLDREDALTRGMDDSAWFYFVHSYAAPTDDATLGRCTHGDTFAAMVKWNNFRGVQFHPERSAESGARLLRNFLEF